MKHKRLLQSIIAIAASCMLLITSALCACNKSNDEIIHSGPHELVYYRRVEPTCTEKGNVEYWQCRLCHKRFSDENAENEVASVNLPKTNHHYSSTYKWDDNTHYRVCTVCGNPDRNTESDHVLRWGIDDEQDGHYRYCYCGYRSEVSPHEPDEDGSGLCKYCRYGRPEYELSDDGTYYIVSRTTMPFKEHVTEFTIPDMFQGLPIKEIADRAFEHCTALTRVVLGSNIVRIGAYAFMDCANLSEVEFNDGLLSIGADAFLEDASITSLVLPNSINLIENSAFKGCSSLESINIPTGLNEVRHSMFFGCESLKSLTMHDGIASIGHALFSGSGIEEFTFPSRITEIPMTVFYNCKAVKSVTVPSTVKSIGMGAFQSCSLEKLYFNGNRAQWDRITLATTPSWCANSHFTVVGYDFNLEYNDGEVVSA